MEKYLARAVLLSLLFIVPSFAVGDEQQVDPDLGTFITTAVAYRGELWVLGASQKPSDVGGALVSFNLGNGQRKLQLSGVTALQKIGNELFALTSDGPEEWKGEKFIPPARLALSDGEKPTGLLAVGTHLGLETPLHLFVLDESGWRTLITFKKISPPKGAWSIDAFGPHVDTIGMPTSATSLYIGINQGEWGGGLSRRDVATGNTSGVKQTDDRAAGQVNDNINAIIADPFHPECVVVAAGLIHFESSGRILRVCGDKASLLFSKSSSQNGYNGHSMQLSEAFFGLVPFNSGFWAVSNAAVYRFDASDEPKRYVLSKFESWHGLMISRDAPGAIVLITEINRRFSVNNGTPLIIPID